MEIFTLVKPHQIQIPVIFHELIHLDYISEVFFTRKDLKNVKSIFRKSNRTTRKKYFLNQIKQGGHFDIGLVFVTVRED